MSSADVVDLLILTDEEDVAGSLGATAEAPVVKGAEEGLAANKLTSPRP